MSVINATANSNISVYTVTSSDILYYNNFVITINADYTGGGTLSSEKGGTLNLSNLTGVIRVINGIIVTGTAGGGMQITGTGGTVTLSGSVTAGVGKDAITLSAASGITLLGTVTLQGTTAGGGRGLNISSSNHIVNLVGTITGGGAASCEGLLVSNGATGIILNFTGNCVGGTGCTGMNLALGSGGSLYFNGSSTGGAAGTSPAIGVNAATWNVTTNGYHVGGLLAGCEGLIVSANAVVHAFAAVGNGFGVTGGTSACPGINNSAGSGAKVYVKKVIYGIGGQTPTQGMILFDVDASNNQLTGITTFGGGSTLTLTGTGGWNTTIPTLTQFQSAVQAMLPTNFSNLGITTAGAIQTVQTISGSIPAVTLAPGQIVNFTGSHDANVVSINGSTSAATALANIGSPLTINNTFSTWTNFDAMVWGGVSFALGGTENGSTQTFSLPGGGTISRNLVRAGSASRDQMA